MKKATDVMVMFAVHTMILCVKSDSWSDFMKGGGGGGRALAACYVPQNHAKSRFWFQNM